MKLWWSLSMVGVIAFLMVIVSASAEADLWEEDEKEVLVRTARGTKERACRYAKDEWSECDAKTNTRTRTLNLKKGDKSCQETKIIQKKCKKGVAAKSACRYEKGTWGTCINQVMKRVDNLKSNSDSNCDKTRSVSRRCKPETNSKKTTNKDDRSNKKSGKQ
ncbi:uncharacterized protein LOC107263335 isoform X2 [Cephus cinctus]|uniref:Uncharacterized protein LOC107263335 isoform X2 n=1 Tax=Cephus cinctus TaxID=211228 RepID=A0AAJ7R929_CEPCN|nr:uncharacterized protein LOC107263335 isoform X2 [Cephus cinctus]XP_024936551.1 uncharacterized protein LOC107263335 isoform X2 [Cephus cinctus]